MVKDGKGFQEAFTKSNAPGEFELYDSDELYEL
jgi:hypothetical protein